MSFDQLNKKRQRIIITYHTLRAIAPQSKKYCLIQKVAVIEGYKLDKKNKSSSYVMKVIREHEQSSEL